MSPSPSRFQLLPYDIVDVIVDHFPPSTDTQTDISTIMAMMHSCHSWRAAYMRRHLIALVLSCSAPCAIVLEFEDLPGFVGPSVYSIDQFARVLTIKIKSHEPLMTGEIVRWMQHSPGFANTSLTSITMLIIDANCGRYSYKWPRALDEVKNMAAFFRHVKSVMPNASSIELALSKCEKWFSVDIAAKSIEKSITDLVHGCNVTFCDDGFQCCIPYISPTAISRITSLSFHKRTFISNPDSGRWIFEVAQRNTGTLRKLASLSIDLKQLEQFLFNDDSPIIYSSLVNMDIEVWDQSKMFVNYVDPISSRYSPIHANHFPVLKCLTFKGSYRMAIGHLLGSENRSLEHLDATVLPVFPDKNDPNRPCPVDVLTRFYGLKTIRFAAYDNDNYEDREPPEYIPMCSYILKSFAGSTSALYYIHMKLDSFGDMLGFGDRNILWAALRGLDLRYTMVSFAQIFDLLTRAPTLRSFICDSDGTLTIDGVDLVKHPECLKERYDPLNTALKEIGFGFFTNPGDEGVDCISWCTVLLATVCPQLCELQIIESFTGLDECFDIPSFMEDGDNISDQAESLSVDLKDMFEAQRKNRFY